MKLFTGSRLFGILLIAASLPLDPGVALAANQSTAQAAGPTPAASGPVEARMRRIALAIQEAAPSAEDRLGQDALSWWNGGFRNGGFRNGGFGNGGFRNGGFWNGGFRNGGFWNGGFRNGGGVFVNF